jgi:hypothetical protein
LRAAVIKTEARMGQPQGHCRYTLDRIALLARWSPSVRSNQIVYEPRWELPPADSAAPTHVGRYRIERVLGRCGFGLVYLAHDDQLWRLVAINVPHRKRVEQHRRLG